MSSIGPSVLLLVIVVGCSKQPPLASPQVPLPPRLQSRFEEYCDETGSLGIGFVAWHTFDYRFRQRLKRTEDPELKRLYVLKNLHAETEEGLDDLEAGIKRAKGSARPLTPTEWRAAHQRILEQIEDLAAYTSFTNFATTPPSPWDMSDPKDDPKWVERLRSRLHSVTNEPGANPAVQRTGASRPAIDTNRAPASADSRR